MSALLLLLALPLSAQQLIPQPREMTVRSQEKVSVRKVDARVDKRSSLPDEGYTLEVKGTTVRLRAKTAQGMV